MLIVELDGRGCLIRVDVAMALTGVAFFLAVFAVFAAGTVASIALCSSVSLAGRTLHGGGDEDLRGARMWKMEVWGRPRCCVV
jgi:hypothetical protein